MAKDLFDEWSSGVKLANTDNDFFEEIPMEVNNPQNFTVTPEQLPENPTAPEVQNTVAEVPAPQLQEPEPSGPEVRSAKKGGKIALEKTSRGWRATLDPELPTLAPENFYAANKDELIFTICESKMEANRTIHKFRKEKLLGTEEQPVSSPVSGKTPNPKVSDLSADDIWEIRNKMTDNPGEALDAWVKKRFGLDPSEFAEALKSAPEAKKIAEAQRVKSEIDEINAEFIGNNPDYAEHYITEENIRTLCARMAKAYLGKVITKKTSQSVIDDYIFEMYQRGSWTAENLETAKDELIESGLLHRATNNRQVSEPTPSQPVTTNVVSPSEPQAPRIATKTGQPVSLGIPAKTNSPAAVPEEKLLTDVDLQKMPLEDLRQLAKLQLQFAKQGRQ